MKQFISRVTICLVLMVVVHNLSAAVATAWLRFEEGTPGSAIISPTNTGTFSSITTTGVDLHTGDGLQPVYSSLVGGQQVQDGVDGTLYANTRSDDTPRTNVGGTDHGSGYLDMRGFYLNSWVTTTIECFYKITDLNLAEANGQYIWYFAPNDIDASNNSDYHINLRHEAGGKLTFLQYNLNTPSQNRVNYTGFTADEWHHLAVVFTGDASGLSSDPVAYTNARFYAFVDYELIGSGPVSSAVHGADRAWFGNFPWWNSGDPVWHMRDNQTPVAFYDEIRITTNSGGTHEPGAALQPTEFLQMMQVAGTALVIK